MKALRTGQPGGGGEAVAEYQRLSMQTVWVSIVGNLFLFGVKYWVAVVSDSLALEADAWHTVSDTLSSLVVLAGLQLARRPPDAHHPFGYGRYELLSTMMVGVMLLLVAIYFGWQGVSQLIERGSAHFGLLAVVVTVVSIVVKEGMAQYALWVARRTGNPAVRADGWHHRSDALSSVLVLVGIAVGSWLWWIDGALSIGVAGLIAWVAFGTMRNAASVIVGERPPEALQHRIEELVETGYPGQGLQPHNVKWHNYVRCQEVTLHIVLPAAMPLEEAHAIATHLEELLWQELAVSATVHMEPPSAAFADGWGAIQ